MSEQYPDKDEHGRVRTPYAVHCEGPWDLPGYGCGLVYLTAEEYDRQINAPNKTWRCPLCRYEASWSDENFEQLVGIEEPDAADEETDDEEEYAGDEPQSWRVGGHLE